MTDQKIETFVRERGRAAAKRSRLATKAILVLSLTVGAVAILFSLACVFAIAGSHPSGHEGPGGEVIALLGIYLAGAALFVSIAQGVVSFVQLRFAMKAVAAMEGPLAAAVAPMRTLASCGVFSGIALGLIVITLPAGLVLWISSRRVSHWLAVELPLLTPGA